MQRLPGRMVGLRIGDPRETMPAVVEALPVLAQTINAQISAQRRQFPGAPAVTPLKIEPDSLPTAGELISRLFPASTALVVDEQGASLIGREPIPGLGSPAIAGLFLGVLMPARSASSEAARRAQCTNNLKQIALAYHNFHAANNAFPAPAITDKDGKPLLSWRVAILPYVEQQELYNKFKLDEPWDSPHNKALIKEMPTVYLCPSRKNPEEGTTTYRVFVGDGAPVPGGPGHADPVGHRRHVQHDHGRRVDRRRALDQARRPEVRPGGEALALWRRLAPPGRLQRRVRRRRGPVHQQQGQSRRLEGPHHPRRRRGHRRGCVLTGDGAESRASWSSSSFEAGLSGRSRPGSDPDGPVGRPIAAPRRTPDPPGAWRFLRREERIHWDNRADEDSPRRR